jgi:hypothetical protein
MPIWFVAHPYGRFSAKAQCSPHFCITGSTANIYHFCMWIDSLEVRGTAPAYEYS